jgi:hypothetical protein
LEKIISNLRPKSNHQSFASFLTIRLLPSTSSNGTVSPVYVSHERTKRWVPSFVLQLFLIFWQRITKHIVLYTILYVQDTIILWFMSTHIFTPSDSLIHTHSLSFSDSLSLSFTFMSINQSFIGINVISFHF